MALVAIHTVVDVSTHALVFLIRIRFGVAARALEHRVVARVGVARGAHPSGTTVIRVKPRMVENCAGPSGHHLVARLASGRETGRHVVRVVCGLVLRLVAGVAIRGQIRVVVIYVATCALDRLVCTH